MKRICVILAAALTLVSVAATAQETLQFAPREPLGDEYSDAVRSTLYQKVSQILNRNSAAAGGDYAIFEVVPALTVSSANSTSGMVQNVNSVKGEFTLTARNSADGAEYYSITVPVSAVLKGALTDPAEALAKAVKITDPAFVRFVRIARQNIEKAFDDCCPTIIGRARTLQAAGRVDDAIALLMSVPPTAKCYDEATELLILYRQEKVDPATVTPAEDDDFSFDEPMEEADESETEEPAEEETEAPKPQIFISNSNWHCALLKCFYRAENRCIELRLKVMSDNGTSGTVYTGVTQAVTAQGDNLDMWKTLTDRWMSFPAEVPVNVVFEFQNVKRNPAKISFLKLKINNVDIEIRNLTVQ